MSSDPDSQRTLRQKLIGFLTTTSHLSAPFITTFLLIHLTAPVAANVGGSDLASSVMLLGREYYQTALTEPALVLGPIAVHSLSGIARRCLLSYRQALSSTSSSSSLRLPSIPLTPLTLTAYPLLLFYALHIQIHRALPSTPTPPISALGPAELDFGFVQYALQRWPVRSFIGYGFLVGLAAVHAVAGAKVLMRRWGVKKVDGRGGVETTTPRKRNSNFSTLALALGATVPVLSGLVVLYREPLFMFEHMASRVRAVFELSLAYRY